MANSMRTLMNLFESEDLTTDELVLLNVDILKRKATYDQHNTLGFQHTYYDTWMEDIRSIFPGATSERTSPKLYKAYYKGKRVGEFMKHPMGAAGTGIIYLHSYIKQLTNESEDMSNSEVRELNYQIAKGYGTETNQGGHILYRDITLQDWLKYLRMAYPESELFQQDEPGWSSSSTRAYIPNKHKDSVGEWYITSSKGTGNGYILRIEDYYE